MRQSLDESDLNNQWRRKFIELSEEIFRELGFSPPLMVHEESLPLAMELELDGISFELLHVPGELSEQIRIMCSLGVIPENYVAHGLEMLLTENLKNSREHSWWYGLDSDLDELLLLSSQDIAGISAQRLLEDMQNMIKESSEWQKIFFDPTFNPCGAPNGELYPILV